MLTTDKLAGPPANADVARLVDLVRFGNPLTRSDLVERSGLGRNAVTAHLGSAINTGLIAQEGRAPSTGGRAAHRWGFRPEVGAVLVASIGVTTYRVAVTDLSGRIVNSMRREWGIHEGPDATLDAVAGDLEQLVTHIDPPIWGLGVSLPGPIDHATGRPSAPPIMPLWDSFDVVGYLEARIGAPVLVDNDVNVMALGHTVPGSDADEIYVRVGVGIGAGILSHGFLHRGARGAAGDIGHTRIPGHDTVVCRCGRIGCLEAVAGGWALERSALRLAADGLSPYLAQVRQDKGTITVEDIADGVPAGDTSCVELVATAASSIGGVLAVLVSFFNPARIIIVGPIPERSHLFRETVQRTIVDQALALATQDLTIDVSNAGSDDAVRGCARMVVDAAFDRATSVSAGAASAAS